MRKRRFLQVCVLVNDAADTRDRRGDSGIFCFGGEEGGGRERVSCLSMSFYVVVGVSAKNEVVGLDVQRSNALLFQSNKLTQAIVQIRCSSGNEDPFQDHERRTGSVIKQITKP